jgi:hypothetical protein
LALRCGRVGQRWPTAFGLYGWLQRNLSSEEIKVLHWLWLMRVLHTL